MLREECEKYLGRNARPGEYEVLEAVYELHPDWDHSDIISKYLNTPEEVINFVYIKFINSRRDASKRYWCIIEMYRIVAKLYLDDVITKDDYECFASLVKETLGLKEFRGIELEAALDKCLTISSNEKKDVVECFKRLEINQ